MPTEILCNKFPKVGDRVVNKYGSEPGGYKGTVEELRPPDSCFPNEFLMKYSDGSLGWLTWDNDRPNRVMRKVVVMK